MDGVIYGGKSKIALGSINWTDLQKAIHDEVGDEPIASPIAGAKRIVEEAKKNKDLKAPFVKVGVDSGNLVFRIEDPRVLFNKKDDTILVKQWKQKKTAYEKMLELQLKEKSEDKGVVVSLDPKDDVIDKAAKSIAKDRKLEEDSPLRREGELGGDKDKKHEGKVVDDEKLKEKPFEGVSNAPIVILAHGSPLGDVGGGKVHATQFAGKKSGDIVNYLKASLPITYAGVVYLDGCYTAAGNTPLNFGKQVYDGLLKAGYFYLQVKGNLGMARTIDGKEFVTPAEIETAYEDARNEKKKIEEERKKINTVYDDFASKGALTMKALIVERAKAGRSKKEDWTEDDKKKHAQASSVLEAITKQRGMDPRLVKTGARLKELDAIIDAPKYNIEALTGTWGPEKLPPKQ